MAGTIKVRPCSFDTNSHLSRIIVEAEFLRKKNNTLEPYDTDKMAAEFVMKYPHRSFTVGQRLTFSFLDKKLLSLVVKDLEITPIEALNAGMKPKPRKTQMGICLPNTTVIFEKAKGSSLNLVGKFKTVVFEKAKGSSLNLVKGKIEQQSITNPDWDSYKMVIGGLEKEMSEIFTRTLASRAFPIENSCKHVKGILLFGPIGTGKTLIARQIGKMLNAKIIPQEVLDKDVEKTEANVRRLFAEAEREEKRLGPNSRLHVFICDDIDGICHRPKRSKVQDAVVTQLLAKFKRLNNILVIATTNRKDLIDDALMWPGRLEVQIEIGLPDERGRHQILNIHTARMREIDRLSTDVDTYELATLTKNFSGADLMGLVRAAQARAFGRFTKPFKTLDPDARKNLKVCKSDFVNALEKDIKPAFETRARLSGHINLGPPVAMDAGSLLIQQVKSVTESQFSHRFIEGTANSSKTALAKQSKTVSKIAKLYSDINKF